MGFDKEQRPRLSRRKVTALTSSETPATLETGALTTLLVDGTTESNGLTLPDPPHVGAELSVVVDAAGTTAPATVVTNTTGQTFYGSTDNQFVCSTGKQTAVDLVAVSTSSWLASAAVSPPSTAAASGPVFSASTGL